MCELFNTNKHPFEVIRGLLTGHKDLDEELAWPGLRDVDIVDLDVGIRCNTRFLHRDNEYPGILLVMLDVL
jgi:hypothetical protein